VGVGAGGPSPTRNAWWEEAACQGHNVTVFFPLSSSAPNYRARATDKDDYASARRICASCTVRAECLDDALLFEKVYRGGGFRGGMTPAEREREGRVREQKTQQIRGAARLRSDHVDA